MAFVNGGWKCACGGMDAHACVCVPVTITVARADLEALLMDLSARKLPDMDTADGTDRMIAVLSKAWRDSVS